MGGSSSPPPAPDYKAAAEATSTGNLDLARMTTRANRVDAYTPYGSLTYSNAGKFDQAGYDAAMQAYGASDNKTGTAPTRQQFTSGDPDTWTAKVELDPVQRQILDAQNQTSLKLSGLQDAASDRVGDSMSKPFSLDGAPARAQGFAPSAGGSVYRPPTSDLSAYTPTGRLPGTFAAADKLTGAALADKFSASSFGSANPSAGELTKADVYANQGPSLSKYYDPRRDTGTATDLLMNRMNPALDREEAAMRTRLSNMGLTPGSEAWNYEVQQAGQKRNDANLQASLQGINLGMAQQGQTFGQTAKDAEMELKRQEQTNEQQVANERLRLDQYGLETQAQLGNARIAADASTSQAANMLGAARLEMDQGALGFNQRTTNIGTGMNQQRQQYDQGLANRQESRAGQAQRFGQTTANNASYQAQQAQQFAQAEALRQGYTSDELLRRGQPLNELNALRTGAQVQNPTFPNTNTQGNVQGPNYSGAATSQYGAAMDAFSVDQAKQQSGTSAAVGIASAVAMAF